MKRLLFVTLSTVFALLPLTSALADGDSRLAKPEETAFDLKVKQVLAKALPPCPAGWVEVDRSEPAGVTRVSPGAENRPFATELHIRWEDQKKIEDAAQKEQEAMARLVQTPQFQPDQDTEEYTRKMEEISKRMEKAMASGDIAAAQKIAEEMQPLQEAIEKKGKAQSDAVEQTVRSIRATNARVAIHIRLNADDQELGDWEQIADTHGFPTWQSEESGQDPQWGCNTRVFVGRWKDVTEDGYRLMKAVPDLAKPSLVGQNLLVTLRCDKSRVAECSPGPLGEVMEQRTTGFPRQKAWRSRWFAREKG